MKAYLSQGGTTGYGKTVGAHNMNHTMNAVLLRLGNAEGNRCRTTEPGKHRNPNMSTLSRTVLGQRWVLNDSPLHITGNQPVATALKQFMPSTNAEKYISVFDE